MKKITTILMLLMLSMGAWADASKGIQLTFNKDGGGNASPGNVAVVVKDMDGNTTDVQATLTATSFSQFKTGNAAALSRNENFAIVPHVGYGNQTGSTIEYTFQITGLPSDFAYNNAALDVYACNSEGKLQPNGGSTVRPFKFEVFTGASTDALESFVSQENNDICTVPDSDGDLYHKLWNMKATNAKTATGNTLYVKVVLTRTATQGCFAGLGKLQLYGYFDYTEQVNADIKPWVDNIGNGYFTLDGSNAAVQALQNAYNAHTGDTWPETEYNNLLTLLNTAKANGFKMPETGYYRIKNTSRSRNSYLAYGLPSELQDRGSGLVAIDESGAPTDASTIFKLTKTADNNYTFGTEGMVVYAPVQNNWPFRTSKSEGDAVTYKFTVTSPGVVAIGPADVTDPSAQRYFHEGDGATWGEIHAVVQWTATAGASQWTIEEANELGQGAYALEIALTTIGDKSYATTYLPFPVKLSEAAAYKVTLSGKKAVEVLIGDEIPAEEAVLLMSETAAEKVYATVAEVTTTVSGNDLKGVLVKTAKTELEGNTPVVLNQSSGKVGFFKLADGKSLSANRAYLSYVEGTTPPSSKAFFEEGFELGGNEATAIENVENSAFDNGAVYNLQGQRVTKAQKGVFIQNGKKVVLK